MPLRSPRVVALGAGVVAGLLTVVVLAGWIIDAGNAHGRVRHHVTVAGVSVGGLDRAALTSEVGKLASSLATTQIDVTAGSFHSTVAAADLGLAVDIPATVELAMGARKPTPVVGWISNLGGTTDSKVLLTVDERKVADAVTRLNQTVNPAPVEPSIALSGTELVAVPGNPGQGIDVADLTGKLKALSYGRGVLTVGTNPAPVQPTHSIDEANAVAAEANAMTATPLRVQAGTAVAELTPAQLRTWIVPSYSGGRLSFGIDSGRASLDLSRMLALGEIKPVDSSFAVADDKVVFTPAVDGKICCTADAPQVILQALQSRQSAAGPSAGPAAPVVLPMAPGTPGKVPVDIEKLGIKEKVSSFTTKHKPGEARVTNIHIAADIVRGTIIQPGGSISLNNVIGPRTTDKGFVLAPTIQDGELVPDIGGGVSQVATTLFNVSFFAGLDYGEYQSHSLYISRYPFGREATVNFPNPDLVIRNHSPYGVLVWTSYTDTSITVDLYSTRWVASVTQGDQTATVAGKSCTLITTPRSIVYVDGKTKIDSVRARYRAQEGLDCDQLLPPGVRLQGIPGKPPIPIPPGSQATPTTTVAPSG